MESVYLKFKNVMFRHLMNCSGNIQARIMLLEVMEQHQVPLLITMILRLTIKILIVDYRILFR